MEYICKFCGKIWKDSNSLKNHELRCKENPDKLKNNFEKYNKEFGSWNRGLTKETDNRVRKSAETLSENIKSGKTENKSVGRKHSEETKQKISKIRKEYLEENPDKVPYVLNHYSLGKSYPEKYWEEILIKNNISYVSEYRIGLYSLDFFINNKIDLEIDGEQHYLDQRIIESDIRRNEFLKSKNITVIRIRWSEYCKLKYEEREIFVNDIIEYIKGL